MSCDELNAHGKVLDGPDAIVGQHMCLCLPALHLGGAMSDGAAGRALAFACAGSAEIGPLVRSDVPLTSKRGFRFASVGALGTSVRANGGRSLVGRRTSRARAQ